MCSAPSLCWVNVFELRHNRREDSRLVNSLPPASHPSQSQWGAASAGGRGGITAEDGGEAWNRLPRELWVPHPCRHSRPGGMGPWAA